MIRVLNPGAIAAGWVGAGVAVVAAISFLLVIPIEPFYWLLAPLAGVLIGYYANQRAGLAKRSWRRTIANAAWAGSVTALTIAVLLLGVKALFFAADNGFRVPEQGGRLTCSPGAECVYARYLAQEGGRARLESAGVRDASSFGAFYWDQQLGTAGRLFGVTLAGSLAGGLLFGLARPGPRRGQESELAAGQT